MAIRKGALLISLLIHWGHRHEFPTARILSALSDWGLGLAQGKTLEKAQLSLQQCLCATIAASAVARLSQTPWRIHQKFSKDIEFAKNADA